MLKSWLYSRLSFLCSEIQSTWECKKKKKENAHGIEYFFLLQHNQVCSFKKFKPPGNVCTIRKEYLVRHNLGIFAVQFEVINVQCNEYLMT